VYRSPCLTAHSEVSDLGFLTMAFGPDRYLRQAETLALSLRRHMPGVPLALITDHQDAGSLFDVIIPMKPIAQAGVVHKVDLYDYSPFFETLFIDSDSIVSRPFVHELNEIREFDFSPVVRRYLVRGESEFFLDDLTRTLNQINGDSFPKFNGGVYFFKKVDVAWRVFARANEMRSQKEAFGIKDFDKAGPNDETLFGLALAELHVSPLYDDHGKLMCTPLGMIGNMRLDALGGGCSFNKAGEMVSPAICHFPGDWVREPDYLTAEYSLRNGRRPRLLFRARVNGRHYLRQYRRKVEGKIASIRSSLAASIPRR
jgi:hypothetical protein